jgi:hypothetical protein
MKQTTSLEDERRALLEQIHSSRETYRRMLTGSDSRSRSRKLMGSSTAAGVHQPQHFPRSMTMRSIMEHPYMSAAAVTAIAMLGTRTAKSAVTHRSHAHPNQEWQKGRAYRPPAASSEATGRPRTARTRSTDFPQYSNRSKPMTVARSAFTGLATLAAMLLRDPRKMQAATSAITAATTFIQSRRSRRPARHHTHTVRVK